MEREYSTESLVHYLEKGHPMEWTPSQEDFMNQDEVIDWLLRQPLLYRLDVCLQIFNHSYHKRSPIPRLLHDLPDDHRLDKFSLGLLLGPSIKNLYIEGRKSAGDSYAQEDEALALKILRGIPEGEEVHVLSTGFQFSRSHALTPAVIDAFESTLRTVMSRGNHDKKDIETLIDVLIDNKRAFGSSTMDIILEKVDEQIARDAFMRLALHDALTKDLNQRTREEKESAWYLPSFNKRYGADWVTEKLIEIVYKDEFFDPSETLRGVEFFDGERFFNAFLADGMNPSQKGIVQGSVLQHLHLAESYPSLLNYIVEEQTFHQLINNAYSHDQSDEIARIGAAHLKPTLINILKKDAQEFSIDHGFKAVSSDNDTREQAQLAYLLKKPPYKDKAILLALGLKEVSDLLGKVDAYTTQNLRTIFDDVPARVFAKIVKGSSRHVLSDDLGL